MENKEMTVKELLAQVRDNLSRIRIPACEMEQIGIPIAQAINALNACVEAINNAEANRNEAPQIELVSVEEENGNA